MIWWFGGWFTIALTTFFCLWLLWMSQIPLKKHIIMGSWPPKHAKLRRFFLFRSIAREVQILRWGSPAPDCWAHDAMAVNLVSSQNSDLVNLGWTSMTSRIDSDRLGWPLGWTSMTCRNCIKKTLGASTTSRAAKTEVREPEVMRSM